MPAHVGDPPYVEHLTIKRVISYVRISLSDCGNPFDDVRGPDV